MTPPRHNFPFFSFQFVLSNPFHLDTLWCVAHHYVSEEREGKRTATFELFQISFMRDKERERELSILLASPSSLPRGAKKRAIWGGWEEDGGVYGFGLCVKTV
jgi:hypothetical protein